MSFDFPANGNFLFTSDNGRGKCDCPGCLSVCLSVSKITQKRVHGFGWHFACRSVSGHGRTDQLLSPIPIIVRNRIAFSNIVCTATRNLITSGKSHVQVLRMGIGRPSQQRRVVLRRRNTVVGGKCALPSALLVSKVVWYNINIVSRTVSMRPSLRRPRYTRASVRPSFFSIL